MTPEELSKLTPEEKRILIAKACGWIFKPENGPLDLPWRKPNAPALEDEKGWVGRSATVPDYASDLNSMHEAEKCLESDKQIESYLDNLTNVCGGDTPVGRASFTAYFATAAQRADAFILTINPTP